MLRATGPSWLAAAPVAPCGHQRVPPLVVALAVGAGAAVEVEASDDRHDGGNVGLVLVVDDRLHQADVTVRAGVVGHAADGVDLCGQRPGGARGFVRRAGVLRERLGWCRAEVAGLAYSGVV